jgi:hypothetical protein
MSQEQHPVFLVLVQIDMEVAIMLIHVKCSTATVTAVIIKDVVILMNVHLSKQQHRAHLVLVQMDTGAVILILVK